jgi:hypothetical protein
LTSPMHSDWQFFSAYFIASVFTLLMASIVFCWASVRDPSYVWWIAYSLGRTLSQEQCALSSSSYFVMDWYAVVIRWCVAGWAILKRSSTTKFFHQISKMQEQWSPGDCFTTIQEPACSGRSGNR